MKAQLTVRAEKVTVYLRGDLALRVDAVAYHRWIEDGRATQSPVRHDAIRELILHPERCIIPIQSMQRHVCTRCRLTYGAPWCWRHGAIQSFTENEKASI